MKCPRNVFVRVSARFARHPRFFEGIHKVCHQTVSKLLSNCGESVLKNVVKLLSKCAVCLSKMCKF